MRITFITVCPNCSTAKLNEFNGLGQSHAEWLQAESKQIEWTCSSCGFTGWMPVRDVDKTG